MKRLTNKDFIERCCVKHNNYYNYSKTLYTRSVDEIYIICPVHGEFKQKAGVHLSGSGCYECGINKISHSRKITTDIFLEKSYKLHGNIYSYQHVNNILSSREKIKLVCSKHGDFLISVETHLSGGGCYKCGRIETGNKLKHNNETFIEKANIKHQNLYTYENVNYKTNNIKVDITCKKHGSFWQTPGSHLSGRGCPICKLSLGELKIKNILVGFDINFIQQYTFDDCRYKLPLPFDFYIPKYNLCIEFDGRHHYEPIEHWGGEEEFKNRKTRDFIKTQFCLKNNIKLLRIKYTDDVTDLLSLIIMEYRNEF